jgi:hypothetical protein
MDDHLELEGIRLLLEMKAQFAAEQERYRIRIAQETASNPEQLASQQIIISAIVTALHFE